MVLGLASVIGRYSSAKYWHFCFKSEAYYYSWKGSKFHHAVCFPAIIFPGEISAVEGRTAMQKRV